MLKKMILMKFQVWSFGQQNTSSWQPYQLLTNPISSTAKWSAAPIPCEVNIYSLQLKVIEQNGSNLSVFDLV
jgi:hypothetical protein